jgi:hypothetical protein
MRRLPVLSLLIAVAAGPVPAVAAAAETGTPSAKDAIHRWVAATGGDKAWRRFKHAALTGDTEVAGVAGSAEMMVARDGFRRLSMEQGDTQEETCAGATAWLRDWNGHVRELEGRDKADERAVGWILSLLYAGGARDLTEAHARVTGEDDAHTRVILRLTAEGVTPIDVFLDKTSFLPTKFVRKPYDDTLVLEPSDWKTAIAVKVPWLLRESGAEDDTEDRTTVRKFALSRDPASPPFGRPKDGTTDVAFTTGRSALSIPFNFENDHIMIDGRVNGGAPIWFMLDTGAETTIVNKPRMAEFGLSPFGAASIEGGGNTTDFSFTKVARLGFPGVEMLNQRDGVIDLTGLEKIYGRKMGGILGYDFFSRFVVRVDYDKRTLDLLDPAGYTYSGAGKKLTFIIESGHPHVASTITVPGTPPIAADMVIDNGAADTANLCWPFVKAHNLLELARKKPAGAPNVLAGSEKEFFAQTSVRGRLSSLTLGPYTLENIPNNLMVAKTGGYATESWSGTIGEGVLRRFNTIYDYARSVMILEPSVEFGTPFKGRKTFGVTFLSEGADYTIFRVTGVRKDSPAEAAGFKKDDIVTTVDDRPAAELHLADLRQMLTTDGAKHTLTVKRGDDTVMLAFVVTLLSLDDE